MSSGLSMMTVMHYRLTESYWSINCMHLCVLIAFLLLLDKRRAGTSAGAEVSTLFIVCESWFFTPLDTCRQCPLSSTSLPACSLLPSQSPSICRSTLTSQSQSEIDLAGPQGNWDSRNPSLRGLPVESIQPAAASAHLLLYLILAKVVQTHCHLQHTRLPYKLRKRSLNYTTRQYRHSPTFALCLRSQIFQMSCSLSS